MNKTIYECALEVFEPLIKIENRMRELEGIMAYDHSDQVMNEYDSLTIGLMKKMVLVILVVLLVF